MTVEPLTAWLFSSLVDEHTVHNRKIKFLSTPKTEVWVTTRLITLTLREFTLKTSHFLWVYVKH